MGRPTKCPYCGSTHSIGRGVRRTKLRGDRRIRECRGCGRRYTPKHQRPASLPEEPAGTAS